MTFLCLFLGLAVGSVLDQAADGLLRFSTVTVSPRPGRADWPGLAIWQGLAHKRWDGPAVLVECLTAFLFAYLWGSYGLSWHAVELAFYGSVFLLITLIDLRYRLVLNVVIYVMVPVVLLTRLVASPHVALSSVLGGAAGLLLFVAVVLIRPGGLGVGDVKLAALIGVVVGFPQVLWALSLGILAGGLGALCILIIRRGGLKSYIPYAPFLCLGAMAVLLNAPGVFPTT